MFLLRAILTAFIIPLLLSLFFFIKDRLILKRESVLFQFNNQKKDKFAIGNLLLAFLIMFVIMFSLYFTLLVFKIWQSQDINFIVSRLIGYFFIGIMFFLIIYHHKIHKYRSIIFILFALMFSIDFIFDVYESRGHFYFFSPENIIQGEIPKCQIGAILPNLIPVLFKNTFISPGKLLHNGIGISYTLVSVIFLWIAMSLALGRGWCSWACFWGGWEEGFSLIKKKPLIKRFNYKFKWVPFALLIVILITSLIFLVPTYCWFLCPWKVVSEAPKIISPINIIQTAIFILVFLSLVVVLPILTKKRTQCAFFCPFGAFQSLVDKINIFRVLIDKDKCTKCKKCIKECPVLSITEKSLEKGNTGFTCIKCGKCIDICPNNAISYYIKGTPKSGKAGKIAAFITRYIFLFVAFIFFGTLGGGEIIDGISRIFLFITTGSFVQ